VRVHLHAPVTCEGFTQEASVLGERVGIGLRAKVMQQARRALNVGEEEGDGAGRKPLVHGP